MDEVYDFIWGKMPLDDVLPFYFTVMGIVSGSVISIYLVYIAIDFFFLWPKERALLKPQTEAEQTKVLQELVTHREDRKAKSGELEKTQSISDRSENSPLDRTQGALGSPQEDVTLIGEQRDWEATVDQLAEQIKKHIRETEAKRRAASDNPTAKTMNSPATQPTEAEVTATSRPQPKKPPSRRKKGGYRPLSPDEERTSEGNVKGALKIKNPSGGRDFFITAREQKAENRAGTRRKLNRSGWQVAEDRVDSALLVPEATSPVIFSSPPNSLWDVQLRTPSKGKKEPSPRTSKPIDIEKTAKDRDDC